MSAVFEFDDDDNLGPQRRDSVTLADLSLDSVAEEEHLDDDVYQLPSFTATSHLQAKPILTPQPESGYSSEVDLPELICQPADETTYEVELGKKSYISSSVVDGPGDFQSIKKKRKVSLDDFEIIKLLGRGA
jgi:hypothetical protein